MLIGALAGYFGGWPDNLLMRITEGFQVMPVFVLAAMVVAFLGAGLVQVVGVISLLAWTETARVMRSEVARVKRSDYVAAARAMAISERRILIGEVVPNAAGPALALGTLAVGRAVLLQAALSFLGLSSPDVISWGAMIGDGQQYIFQAWWLTVFPGIAIFLTVMVFNLFGDSMSGALTAGRRR